jgi:hypothetical protein
LFKTIPSFPNYMINRVGEVQNYKNKILSSYTDRYGYLVSTLYLDKKRKKRTVHSLVMETFVHIRKGNCQINHIDGDKKNNKLENLEYCTASDNLSHAYRIGLKSAIGERNGFSKICSKDVVNIKKMLANGQTQKLVASFFEIDQSTVSNIKTGKLWSHVK